MVPLFMAGDKYFFYYVHKAKKELGIKLNSMGAPFLWKIPTLKQVLPGLVRNLIRRGCTLLIILINSGCFCFVSKNLLTNPAYLNQSLPDTLGSHLARYLLPRKDYFHLFRLFEMG